MTEATPPASTPTPHAAPEPIALSRAALGGWILVGAAGLGLVMTLVPWLDAGIFTANPWGVNVMGEGTSWWTEDVADVDMIGMIRAIAPVLVVALALAAWAGSQALRRGRSGPLAMGAAVLYLAGVAMAIVAMVANEIDIEAWAIGSWVSVGLVAAVGIGGNLARA